MDKKVDNLVNEQITAKYVFVIDENGEKLGKLLSDDALGQAYSRGYDLVCVSPNAELPVCKFMDYSKFRYEQMKHAKEAKKNQVVVEIKEIRLSPTIDTGDLDTKYRQANKFLSGGDKVKISCRFRGRMIEQANVTKDLFLSFAERLADVSQIDSQPLLDGRNMSMMLGPKSNKKKN